MNLICYLPPRLAANHPLRRLLLHGLPQFTRQIFESLSALERWLTCPGQPDSILVLVAMERGDLERLVAMADICSTRRVVLILPEDGDGLKRMGHRLRPRFMTCLDCSTDELEAVLTKLGDRRTPPTCHGFHGSADAKEGPTDVGTVHVLAVEPDHCRRPPAD